MSKNPSDSGMVARSGSALRGQAAIDGDKSISHRALILGALCVGQTNIYGLLEGEDILATADALRAFGADIVRADDGRWSVHGVGVGGFCEPEQVIDCGNSGTSARLLIGAMATTPISATFSGDRSLTARPMGRIIAPLGLFGAHAACRSGDRLPLTMIGADALCGVHYRLPMASAQVKSALLLAGLNAAGETIIEEPQATRDHTERMLTGFGVKLDISINEKNERVICLSGQCDLTAQDIFVPRDASSAAFPAVAALIVAGSDICIPGVGRNPTRTGLYETLTEMGAKLHYDNLREEGGELVGDLHVKASALKAVDIPPERVSSMIDEFPALSVAAAFAEGATTMRGIKELRFKESDRIDAIARGLRANGVTVDESEDALTIYGRGGDGVIGGGRVQTFMDHRIAMAFLCLGLGAQNPVSIDSAAPIATSFPNFLPLMQQLGANLQAE